MPRYYFHVEDHTGRTSDDAGQVLTNDKAAYQCAVDNIRSIISDEARQGILEMDGHIDVCRGGKHVRRVTFGEAFEDVAETLADNDNAQLGKRRSG